jgi:hypothetical protein
VVNHNYGPFKNAVRSLIDITSRHVRPVTQWPAMVNEEAVYQK